MLKRLYSPPSIKWRATINIDYFSVNFCSLSSSWCYFFFQMIWYILKQIFTSASVKVVDIYLTASRLDKYPPLFTSTPGIIVGYCCHHYYYYYYMHVCNTSKCKFNLLLSIIWIQRYLVPFKHKRLDSCLSQHFQSI